MRLKPGQISETRKARRLALGLGGNEWWVKFPRALMPYFFSSKVFMTPITCLPHAARLLTYLKQRSC